MDTPTPILLFKLNELLFMLIINFIIRLILYNFFII
jgi:hypothetical protein